MTKKIILLFSHNLTQVQIDDVKNNWGITEIVNLPLDLQKQWSNVPPELESITGYFKEIRLWLIDIIEANDVILIQGDFGATVSFVNWAFKNNLIPVYSTTERIHKEKKLDDGSIEIRKTFSHKIFRTYTY